VAEGLGALIREEWASLLTEGFEIADEDSHPVLLTSPRVSLVAAH